MNIPSHLLDAIGKRECVLYAGAGFSLEATLPDGEKLPAGHGLGFRLAQALHRDKYLDRKPDLENDTFDFAKLADDYEGAFGRNALIKFILEIFADGRLRPGEAHAIAVRLFPTIITTNYDRLFENAAVLGNVTHHVIHRDKQLPFSGGGDGVTIYKIHGGVDDPERIVVTNADYRKNPIPSGIEVELRSALSKKTVLFVGCGFADTDYEEIHQSVLETLGELKPMAFAVLPKLKPDAPNAKLRELFFKRWGNRGVTFLDGKAGEFLARVSDELNKKAPPNDPKPKRNTGGHRRFNSAWYVSRPSEEQAALKNLKDGEPVAILAPKGFGKTWFKEFLLTQCQDLFDKFTVVPTDLSFVGRPDSSDILFRQIGGQIAQSDPAALGGKSFGEWWDGQTRLTPAAKMIDLLETHIKRNGVFILTIEGLEQSLTWPALIKREFLDLLRSLGNIPTEIWSRFRLVCTLSTAVSLWTDEIAGSPFHTPPIKLGSFDVKQLGEMAKQHGIDLDKTNLEKVKEVTGGHPYLARRIFSDAQGRSDQDVQAALDSAHNIFQDFLIEHRNLLTQKPELLEEMRRFRHGEAEAKSVAACWQLESAGLLEEVGRRRYRLRIDLYQDLLD